MTPGGGDDGAERERHSRQARFRGVGAAGQERIRAARVAVVGCGALGSVAVDLLARAGVGHLTVVDRDFVELSNLQRQVLFEEADAAAALPKAIAAARAVARIDARVAVEPLVADVTAANVERVVGGAEVVLDGTDNFETRYVVNDACVKLGIPWIYGAAVGATGMAAAIVPGETPCLRCLFPAAQPAGGVGTCETVGVLGSIVMVVAAVQFTEALKILVGDRARLARGLATFDVWSGAYGRAEGLERDPDCPCCGLRRFDFLAAEASSRSVALCGRDAVQVTPAAPLALDLADLARRLAPVGAVRCNEFVLRLAVGAQELTVFPDGRAIVKGTGDVGVARSLYARFVGA